jgi:hypothetical protein
MEVLMMRRRFFRIVAAAAIVALPILAGDDIQSKGLFNGRAWKAMTQDMKIGYLTGYEDRQSVGSTWSAAEKEHRTATDDERTAGIPKLSNQAIAKLLDEFYYPENLNIPISFALQIVDKISKGIATADVLKTLDTVRTIFPHADDESWR